MQNTKPTPGKSVKVLPVSEVCARSYTLSRVWAWICRIEITPHLSVPVPRQFTRRDP